MILSNQISSFLFPIVDPKVESFIARSKSFLPLNDTALSLLRDPDYKLLGMRYVP